jgi:hypothetical protein
MYVTVYLTECSCLLVREITSQNGDLHYNKKGEVISPICFPPLQPKEEENMLLLKGSLKSTTHLYIQGVLYFSNIKD